VIDTANDPHEISLDENVTRENMHPADQFEAFKKLQFFSCSDETIRSLVCNILVKVTSRRYK
jgi:hypothetical protein